MPNALAANAIMEHLLEPEPVSKASTATAGSHPGAPLEEDAGQQNSSLLGNCYHVDPTSMLFTLKHWLRSSAGGRLGSLSGYATQWIQQTTSGHTEAGTGVQEDGIDEQKKRLSSLKSDGSGLKKAPP
ncbi:Uncharacterized protein Rs2_45070 [Raphanus sativus]|nr:Uncharacterized protein Rs2_45070 [Raphanus sativus]